MARSPAPELGVLSLVLSHSTSAALLSASGSHRSAVDNALAGGNTAKKVRWAQHSPYCLLAPASPPSR